MNRVLTANWSVLIATGLNEELFAAIPVVATTTAVKSH